MLTNPSLSGTLPGSWSTLTALQYLYVLPCPLVALPSPLGPVLCSLTSSSLYLLLLLGASLFLYSL